MKTEAEIRTSLFLQQRRSAFVVFCIVGIVWLGWLLNIPILQRGLPSFPPMSPLSALAVASLAIVAAGWKWISRGVHLAIGIGVGAISFGLVVLGFFIQENLPIAIKFFADGPDVGTNNFAPLTPFCLFLLSIVVVLYELRRAPRLRQTFEFIVFGIVYVILVGHISQAEFVRTFGLIANMSLPAEFTILLLARSFLIREDEVGVMKLLRSTSEGGLLLRQIIIQVLWVPVAVTTLVHAGVQLHAYTESIATALSITVNVALFQIVVWRLALKLDALDTLRVTAEAEVLARQRSLEVFQRATDASTEGIIMTDTRGDILYVNEAWEKLTGWKLSQVQGKNPRILKSNKTDPSVYTKMWKAVSAGKSFFTDGIINKRKNGREYDAELHIYPVRQGKGKTIYVGLEQDISERKAVERSKSEFVSIASHQLATPLTSMRWTLELLAGMKTLHPNERHYVETITNTNLRMIALVNALLNTSRIDIGSFLIIPKPIQIKNEIRSVLEEVQREIVEKKLRVTVQSSNATKQYNADPTLLRIIIQNLLTNAIRYTPEGGTITITHSLDAQRCVLMVQDSGIGIPPEDQGKIFGKMYRAANAVSAVPNGSGLGLFVVKGIVERSGGAISFTSELGKGTAFIVSWPAKGWPSKSGTRELSYQPQNEYTV